MVLLLLSAMVSLFFYEQGTIPVFAIVATLLTLLVQYLFYRCPYCKRLLNRRKLVGDKQY